MRLRMYVHNTQGPPTRAKYKGKHDIRTKCVYNVKGDENCVLLRKYVSNVTDSERAFEIFRYQSCQ